MKSNIDTVIIGAGLTGLTTAYYLKKQGKSVLILEKSDRAGGVIDTKTKDGFTFETGPNTGTLSNIEVCKLFDDLSCELETANKEAEKRLIWKNKKWHALPSGIIDGLLTPLFSLKDKLGILFEPLKSKGVNPYETLSNLVKRRLGKSFLDYAIDPFISGIYAGDPNCLVTKYALPKLYNLEQKYGSFIMGGFKKAKEKKTDDEQRVTKEIFSAKGGLLNLVKSLVEKIGEENILFNCDNVEIEKTSLGYKSTFMVCDEEKNIDSNFLVTTVGAYLLEKTLPFLDQKMLNLVTDLEYPKVVEVVVGYKKWNGMKLNAFGGLVPSKEKQDILGALFLSSFFTNRAPKDGALITYFLGGSKRPDIYELSYNDIIYIVKKASLNMFGADIQDTDLIHLKKYKNAIPQYCIKSEKRFETINYFEEMYKGLFLAGSIINGISMGDRILQGKNIAAKICK